MDSSSPESARRAHLDDSIPESRKTVSPFLRLPADDDCVFGDGTSRAPDGWVDGVFPDSGYSTNSTGENVSVLTTEYRKLVKTGGLFQFIPAITSRIQTSAGEGESRQVLWDIDDRLNDCRKEFVNPDGLLAKKSGFGSRAIARK